MIVNRKGLASQISSCNHPRVVAPCGIVLGAANAPMPELHGSSWVLLLLGNVSQNEAGWDFVRRDSQPAFVLPSIYS